MISSTFCTLPTIKTGLYFCGAYYDQWFTFLNGHMKRLPGLIFRIHPEVKFFDWETIENFESFWKSLTLLLRFCNVNLRRKIKCLILLQQRVRLFKILTFKGKYLPEKIPIKTVTTYKANANESFMSFMTKYDFKYTISPLNGYEQIKFFNKLVLCSKAKLLRNVSLNMKITTHLYIFNVYSDWCWIYT